jgi:DNA-binding NarL/FixJ family response regulator
MYAACGASLMNPEPKDTFQTKGRGAVDPVGGDALSGQSKKVRIRVLIGDDHGVVREGLASMINRNRADMTVVGEASNGREALELWQQEHPDVTLLDLRMPEMDGVDVIKEIRVRDKNARIIVLTTFDGDEDIYRAIRAGAKGYLLKDITREALMDSIRRVHMGETCVPLHLIAKLTDRVSGETLSERELEVLRLMAKGKSNKEIASALFISEGTVKSHGKSIFAKLNVASRTEAVTKATRRGFLRL